MYVTRSVLSMRSATMVRTVAIGKNPRAVKTAREGPVLHVRLTAAVISATLAAPNLLFI